MRIFSFALRSAVLSAAALLLASCAQRPITATEEKPMASNPKQQVIDLLKSIETGDRTAAAHVSPQKYVQHNLAVGDGLAGFGAVLKQLPPGSARVNTVRVFQDGDYVFTHTDYDFFGPKVGFDIFRLENGLIVEHWDNLQDKPSKPNPALFAFDARQIFLPLNLHNPIG